MKKLSENIDIITVPPVVQIPFPSSDNRESEPFFLASDTWNNKLEFSDNVFKQITQHGLIRVAAYIRVSTDNENQEESYEIQKEYFTQLLLDNPAWICAGIYSDYGISGTSKEHRTGFNRLLRHCQEGRIDRIVSKSISRFARNTRDFIKAMNVLKENHVTIAFEKEHLDTAIARNDFYFTTFEAIAQEESRSISENVKWGIKNHYPKGEARNIPIYGYRYIEGDQAFETTESGFTFRRIEIVEREAEIVRRIFKEVADGKSLVAVARELNYDNIPPPETALSLKRKSMLHTPKGTLHPWLEEGWTGRHISQIIKLERYAGDVLLQKTFKLDYLSNKVQKNTGQLNQYYVKDHHPAIISRELYEEVQVIRNRNNLRSKNRTQRNTYPFSGRLLCAHCGRFYRTRNRDHRPVWFCSTTAQKNGKQICYAKRIFEEQIVRMCRRAVIERFRIISGTLRDAAGESDIFSGNYTAVNVRFHTESYHIVTDLIQKLQNIQKADDMEHDLTYIKRQISMTQDRIEEKKREINRIEAELDVAKIRHSLLNKDEINMNHLLKKEENSLREYVNQEEKLLDQLEYMEHYFTELESDYEWREKAIVWMQTLPQGQQGTVDFLNGLTDEYIKAFILSIEIVSPLEYKVHWFDDTWSYVLMYSNVEELNPHREYQRVRQERKEQGTIKMNIPIKQKKARVSVIPATRRHMQNGDQFRKQRELRVAAYCRVSTDEESQQGSYAAQKNHYMNLIVNKEGWEMVGIYADEAKSGTSRKSRKQFNQMMEDALSGKIDYIITKSISRFARNTQDALDCVHQLQRQRPPVGIYFERENIDTLNSNSEMFLTFYCSMAQEESHSISENIKWSIIKNFKSGKPQINLRRMLGYDQCNDGGWIINKDQAKTVRYIYERFLQGVSGNGIAKELNSQNRKTVNGGLWRADAVYNILRNEKYVGDLVMQKTFTESFLTHRSVPNNGELQKYFFENHHEAIIDRETWDKTQELLVHRAHRGRPYSKTIDTSTGKIEIGIDKNEPVKKRGAVVLAFNGICCGECSSPMRRMTYNKTIRNYQDIKETYSSEKGYKDVYTFSYAVWKCPKSAGKKGKKDGDRTCGALTLTEISMEQSFMEMIYRIKRDCQLNGEKSELIKNFYLLYDELYQKEINSGFIEQKLELLDQEINELENNYVKICQKKKQDTYISNIYLGIGPGLDENISINADKEYKENIYSKLAADLKTLLDEKKAKREKLMAGRGVTHNLKQNFESFLAAMYAMPDHNTAGMPLNINTLDVEAPYLDMAKKNQLNNRSSNDQSRNGMSIEVSKAPDYLDFSYYIFKIFVLNTKVNKDEIQYNTTFGLTLTASGNSRPIHAFIGYRRGKEDGTIEMIKESYQIAKGKIQHHRRKRKELQ